MDPRELNSLGMDAAATAVIGRYLSALDAALPGGRRARREFLTEIADGLACAVTDAGERGVSAHDAATAAVRECGDPHTVAMAFAGRLGPAVAHRLGIGLVLAGPFIGLIWVSAYASDGPGWPARIAQVLSTMPQYPLILAVTVPAALVATTGAGRAARYLTVPSRRVTGAALVAAIGCVAGDLSLLTMSVTDHLLAAHGPVGLVVLAVTASLVRLSVAAWAGRRITGLRAAVN